MLNEYRYDTLKFKFGDVDVVINSQPYVEKERKEREKINLIYSTENQHIQHITGLLLWPASTILSDFMVKNKSLFKVNFFSSTFSLSSYISSS